MANKNQIAADRIVGNEVGSKIPVRNGFTDELERTFIDFDVYDYITKKALEGLGIITPPNPTTITAGVDVTPLVIPYAISSNPGYTLQRTSDNSYDWNTGVIYDGTNFTINGADDGTGHFADSFTFAIKP